MAYLSATLAQNLSRGNGQQNSLLVLALAGEGELVLGLAVGDFVDAEPLVGGAQQAGQVPLDVLDVVQLGGQRVVDVDHDDLPVRLLLVQQGHDAQHLDLLDLARVADQLADLAHVQRVVVALGLGLRVDDVGVFPGLEGGGGGSVKYRNCRPGEKPYLGEGAVVPEVALVGEAVADEAQFALLDVLLDGVQELVLGDLSLDTELALPSNCPHRVSRTDLLLGIGPARDLDNHVEDGLLLIGVERDVVEGRQGHAVLLDVHAVLQRVGRGHLADAVLGRHCASVLSGSCGGCRVQVAGYLRSA